MRLKIPITILLFLQAIGTSCAEATTIDGNEFLRLHESGTTNNRQFLIGYVAGWFDSLEITDPSISKCLNADVRMSQISDSVALHLKKNPEIRHLHPIAFIKIVLKDNFGCATMFK
jgi:hypothetical protein